jgi:hypothetical protein
LIFYDHKERCGKSNVTPNGFIVHFCTFTCMLIVFLLKDAQMAVTGVTDMCC